MPSWSFLTNHARVLTLVAQDPEARLRDIAGALDVTDRTAFAIVVDLTEAGYIVKERVGRRNRYHIRKHLPVPDKLTRTVGEFLDLLVDTPGDPSP